MEALFMVPALTNNLQLINCTIERNFAFSGAAVYMDSSKLNVSFCRFNINTAINQGGGIYLIGCDSVVIDSSKFNNNNTQQLSGGHVYSRTTNLVVKNSVLSEGSARHGGAIAARELSSRLSVFNCEFENNTTSINVNGFGAAIDSDLCCEVNIVDSRFENNSCAFGGAIAIQQDSGYFMISGCEFYDNTATQLGGAISISGDWLGEERVPTGNILNSVFVGNKALLGGGGGAIMASVVNLNIKNSLIANNDAELAEGGGVYFRLRYSDVLLMKCSIVNSTIVNNNSRTLGAGVNTGIYGPGEIKLTLQNNIFKNVGDNFGSRDLLDRDVIVSKGGNLSSDSSLIDVFVNTNDLNNTDPLFIDFDLDFRLQDLSPCVNNGISAGAPAFDLIGNPRLGNVDMGAYENQNVSSVFSRYFESFGQLDIQPNPVIDQLHFSLENEWIGEIDIRLLDQFGKVMYRNQEIKHERILATSISATEYPAGIFYLHLSNGVQQSVKKVVISQ